MRMVLIHLVEADLKARTIAPREPDGTLGCVSRGTAPLQSGVCPLTGDIPAAKAVWMRACCAPAGRGFGIQMMPWTWLGMTTKSCGGGRRPWQAARDQVRSRADRIDGESRVHSLSSVQIVTK